LVDIQYFASILVAPNSASILATLGNRKTGSLLEQMGLMANSKTLGDNYTQLIARISDSQPGHCRLQRGNLRPYSL